MDKFLSLIAFIAGVVVSFASPVYFIVFLVDVFSYGVGFWRALVYNLVECVLVEVIAYIIFLLCALLIGLSKKRLA